MSRKQDCAVDLYWLPLGAGGRVVRWNGRLYEVLSALRQRREPHPLFHSALAVQMFGRPYVIEMGPVWNLRVRDRGVVAEGPVGTRRLGRLRAFRYEVRCWAGGAIPDVAEAVDSPQRLSSDQRVAAQVLALVSTVPRLTWGRDELRLGDMWNSNSLTAWVLARCGIDSSRLEPPRGGRAPGWAAGVELAHRQVSGRNLSPLGVRNEPVISRSRRSEAAALGASCWTAGRAAVAVEALTAAAALIGGVLLVAAPDGSLLRADPDALAQTPFPDWRLPGLLLAAVVGGGYAVTAACAARHWRYARELTAFAGCGLVLFELAELVWIGPQPLEAVFAGVGTLLTARAVRTTGRTR